MKSRSDLGTTLELGARLAVVRATAHAADAVADHLDLELGGPVVVTADLFAPSTDLRVVDVTAMTAAEWHAVDEARERLTWPVVLVGDEAALARLAAHAPHLWSLVGAHVFDWAPRALDADARLASLREGTGLSDADVLARAEARTLPADPVFAEWLALLGRGDLLG
jgi:hypothetical protein